MVIVATSTQTRFYLPTESASKEIDIQGLNLAIATPRNDHAKDGTKRAKGKTTARTDGIEILTDSNIRIKVGVHYALVGRNGTGKSTIFRAMADHLIPGLQDNVHISVLQQSVFSQEEKEEVNANLHPLSVKDKPSPQNITVLQHVLGSDKIRNDMNIKINGLSDALESENPLEVVKTIRKLRQERVEHEFFLAQKMANLRSGSRGFQARKDLKTAEGRFAESRQRVDQNLEECDALTIEQETRAATDLLSELQAQHDSIKAVDIAREARKVLLGLGFKESWFENPVQSLSGGWRMRCTLAGVLIQHADVLILDEPTNFLDLLGIVWLQTYLIQMRERQDKSVLIVSHDRDFLNAVCEELIILQDQKLTYFRGNLLAYEQDLEEQKLYWGRMKETQDRHVAQVKSSVRENVKQGKKTGDDKKIRQAKSREKKVDERMGVQVNAKGHKFKLNRDRAGFHNDLRDEIVVPVDEKEVLIGIPDAPDLRFPGPLMSMEGVQFRYGVKDPVLLDGIDLSIHMGDRIGIMGLNGSGKSTLVSILIGERGPTKGTVSSHPRLQFGYYSQHSVDHLASLGRNEPELTALALITRDSEGNRTEGQLRGLLSSLGLFGKKVSDVPVAHLSGGQLVRLALGRLLIHSPHLLVLDEITTHLDFHTVVALADALSDYNGALILVSHDRYLIRRVVEGRSDKEGIDEEEAEEESSRRRVVYVLRQKKLNPQDGGVTQFEDSLSKRVNKMFES